MKTLNLKLLRESKHLTQSELSQKLGYRRNSYISLIETGVRKMPQTLEDKLTKMFGDLSEYYTLTADNPGKDNQELIKLPQSILDDLRKLTDTVCSQQRIIEKLLNQLNNK